MSFEQTFQNSEMLQNISQYLPYGVLGTLGLLGLGIVVIMGVLFTKNKKAALEKALQAPVPGDAKGVHEKLLLLKDYLFKLLSLKSYLIQWGILPKEDLKKVFQESLHIQKDYLGSRQAQYKLPWYLMLGAKGSGKTTLLNNAELDMPMGHPEYQFDEYDSRCKWWFFDKGIVVDPEGGMVLGKDNEPVNEGLWSQVLHLLSFYRTKRPLDGVILTIPCHEIFNIDDQGKLQIIHRAKKLQTKLWQIQRELGMRVPVYVMVTKCDHINGFREFASEIPQDALNEVFGWSSPYSLDAAYDPSWAKNALDTIQSHIHRIRSEIFTEKQIKSNKDGAFVFKNEFLKVTKGLRTYVDNLFKESRYHETFFLRGIYFSGDTGHHTAVSQHRKKSLYAISPESVGSEVEIPFKQFDKTRVSFVRDFLSLKVFPEFALARPVTRYFVSNNKYYNFLKVVITVFLVGSFVGMMWSKAKLEKVRTSLYPLIRTIEESVRGSSTGASPQNITFMNTQSVKILSMMSNLDVQSSFSLFIPPSWFSGFDRDIQKTLTLAWDRVILRSFYSGLIKKSQDLYYLPSDSQALIRPGHASHKPLKAKTFQHLKTYVKDVKTFEKLVSHYNDLDNTRDIHVIGKLVKYLYNYDLPEQFYGDYQYYTTALGATDHKEIPLKNYSLPARRKLRFLFDSYIKSIMTLDRALPKIVNLNTALNKLTQVNTTQGFQGKELSNLLSEIFQAYRMIQDKELAWLKKREFSPGEAYNDVLEDIEKSTLFSKPMAKELDNKAHHAYKNYKNLLKTLSFPITGDLFSKIDDSGDLDPVTPSPQFTKVVEQLKDFQKEPFIQAIQSPQAISAVKAGQMMLWDENALKSVKSIVSSYTHFVGTILPQMPLELRNALKFLAQFQTRTHIFHGIARAQNFQPEPSSDSRFDMRESILQQVQNYKDVAPLFSGILGSHMQGDHSGEGSRLRKVIRDELLKIMNRVETLQTLDNPYGLGQDDFSWWNGQEPLGFRAFGVYDLEDMKTYLSSQLRQVSFLAKDITQPIISFLNIPYFKTGQEINSIFMKWQRIIDQINDHEKKTPGNSISRLEEFILVDMTSDSRKCQDLALNTDVDGHHGDFFLSKLNALKMKRFNRCRKLMKGAAVENYSRLSQFFNNNLSGRFPFSKEPFPEKGDAAPRDIYTFYQIMDQMGKIQQKILSLSAGSHRRDLETFFQMMEKAKPFLLAGLSNEIPKIDLAVKLRTDRSREIGGNQIIDWNFQINEKKISLGQKDNTTSWRVSNPITLGLRWAELSPYIPVKGGAKHSIAVDDRDVTFTFNNDYGLLRLIRLHSEKTLRKSEARPVTLSFEVPTLREEASQKARVYLKMAFVAPIETSSGNVENTLLAAPEFPSKAPLIKIVHSKKR